MNPRFIENVIDMYLNAEVINKVGQKGVVDKIITHTIIVKFEGSKAPIKFTFPDAFEQGYLKLTDEALEKKINDKLAKLEERNAEKISSYKVELRIEELKAKKKAEIERKKRRELNKQKKISEESVGTEENENSTDK